MTTNGRVCEDESVDRTIEVIGNLLKTVKYVRKNAKESFEDGFVGSAEVLYGAAMACAGSGLETCASVIKLYSVDSADFDHMMETMKYTRKILDVVDSITEDLVVMFAEED